MRAELWTCLVRPARGRVLLYFELDRFRGNFWNAQEDFAHVFAGSSFGNGRLQLASLLHVIRIYEFMVSAIDLAKRALETFLKRWPLRSRTSRSCASQWLRRRGLILASDAAQRVIRCRWSADCKTSATSISMSRFPAEDFAHVSAGSIF